MEKFVHKGTAEEAATRNFEELHRLEMNGKFDLERQMKLARKSSAEDIEEERENQKRVVTIAASLAAGFGASAGLNALGADDFARNQMMALGATGDALYGSGRESLSFSAHDGSLSFGNSIAHDAALFTEGTYVSSSGEGLSDTIVVEYGNDGITAEEYAMVRTYIPNVTHQELEGRALALTRDPYGALHGVLVGEHDANPAWSTLTPSEFERGEYTLSSPDAGELLSVSPYIESSLRETLFRMYFADMGDILVNGEAYSREEAALLLSEMGESGFPSGVYEFDFGPGQRVEAIVTEEGVFSTEHLRVFQAEIDGTPYRFLYGSNDGNVAELARQFAERDGEPYAYVSNGRLFVAIPDFENPGHGWNGSVTGGMSRLHIYGPAS